MDLYSTHVPYLARAICKLGGPVLELGAGWYSTPLIRTLTDDVLTVETNNLWISHFDAFTEKNPIIHVSDFNTGISQYLGKHWSIVFIDCEFAEQRVFAGLNLTDVTCVVCHDTENDYWNPVIAKYKYIKHWTQMIPNTSYLSNVLDVSTL